MANDADQFVFMSCRRGAEGALKREVARVMPTWRLAYSRPGYLTFKLPVQPAISPRELPERLWTFAHAHGISLGRLTASTPDQLADQVWQLNGVRALASSDEFADVHVWAPGAPPEADPETETDVLSQHLQIEESVRNAAPEACHRLRRRTPRKRRPPTPRGGLVLDIAVMAPGEWWIGCHQAVSWPQRWPGGAAPIIRPAHCVSRAYAKLEEALAWSGLPLTAGDECVEIGCAPGGASQALLDRGLFVTGIDPAEVDQQVIAHPRFRHLKKRGRDVRRQEFIGVRWLVADMNIAPEATLDEVDPIVTHPGVSLLGIILTLKLSDWSIAERLPEFVARVRGWGYRDVRIRQLTTGGQEVCLVALRRKALRRLRRANSQRLRPAPDQVGGKRRTDKRHPAPFAPHF